MKLLLDTHAVLWWMLGDARFSPAAKAVLSDPANEVYLSSISVVEMAIKIRLGKLTLPLPLDQFVRRITAAMRAIELPLLTQHASALAALPLHHRDPFDRLLVTQALAERLQLVTADSQITRYGVPVIW
jgi:PIN domain nuclease of toxin-antitoxin system